MIQLASLMVAMGIFFGVIGALRGWSRELVVTAAILLAMFALFQFDPIFRGTLYLALPLEQVFLAQAAFFLAFVFLAYQAGASEDNNNNDATDWQKGALGALVGFINGYLITGNLWYLLDINEYPLTQYVTAPAPDSPSAQALSWMPMLVVNGGAVGSADLLAMLVVVLLFIVILSI